MNLIFLLICLKLIEFEFFNVFIYFILYFLANAVNNLPKPVPKITESTTKRSLNLEDYKKKRGLI